jgi:density-regulated protein
LAGLLIIDVDLKKASKMFAGKFAASSSVSKTGAGQDEIVIQGDCSFDLMDFIIQNFSVTEKDVEIVEGKKK